MSGSNAPRPAVAKGRPRAVALESPAYERRLCTAPLPEEGRICDDVGVGDKDGAHKEGRQPQGGKIPARMREEETLPDRGELLSEPGVLVGVKLWRQRE